MESTIINSIFNPGFEFGNRGKYEGREGRKEGKGGCSHPNYITKLVKFIEYQYIRN